MRLISWNVNGIRAVAKKGFLDTVKALDPDVLCIQETKASVDQLDDSLLNIPGYKSYFSSAERKGYSGTCVYTKREPVSVSYGLGTDEDGDDDRNEDSGEDSEDGSEDGYGYGYGDVPEKSQDL